MKPFYRFGLVWRSTLSLVFLVLLAINGTHTVSAARFGQVYVRLDRSTANAALSGLVCATPSSAGAGTEARVVITFPSDFSISSSTSNWTTGTSNLPAGATAWPGITVTAQSVSGQTVTFGSNNLTAVSQYCFTFSSSASTTGSAGAKTGSVETQTAGSATIDDRGVGFSIGSDRITVTGRVPSDTDDFDLKITTSPVATTFPQNTGIEYTITYTSRLTYTTPLTLEAEWTQGTIGANPYPSIEIVEYMTSTATYAYGNAFPTTDLLAKRITWVITDFPGGTTKQVKFRLETNQAYTGTSDVRWNLIARLSSPDLADPLLTSKTYKYIYQPEPPPPTATPKPPPPTPTPPPLIIRNVSIPEVKATEFSVHATTSEEALFTIQYGTKATALTKRLQSITYDKEHNMTIEGLEPDTSYYFRLSARTRGGKGASSDIYVVKTAKEGNTPLIEPTSLIFTSSDVIVMSSIGQKIKKPTIVLPRNLPYAFQFALDRPELVKQVRVDLLNPHVLGIQTDGTNTFEPNSTSVDLIEIRDGVYEGRLKTPNIIGTYTLAALVVDANGARTNHSVANMKVTNPLTILGTNKKPLENARVLLSHYNPRTQLFETISAISHAITNPIYTDINGEINSALPQGRYSAHITALGYANKDVDFTIGAQPGEEFPRVEMKYEGMNFFTYVEYYWTILRDALESFRLYMRQISNSNRFFEFNAMIAVSILSLLTLLALRARVRVPLHHLIQFLTHHAKISGGEENRSNIIKCIVKDKKSKLPISPVDIYALDRSTEAVVAHTRSNKAGFFSFIPAKGHQYLFEIMHDGYHPRRVVLEDLKQDEQKKYIVTLETHGQRIGVYTKMYSVGRQLMSFSFELFLSLSFFFEIVLGYTLGWSKAWPFIVLSVLNLAIWVVHNSKNREKSLE